MSRIISELHALCLARGEEVEAWFARKKDEKPPFFYSSVDLRHSGEKLVPVDTNLFPAGFNHLSPAGRRRASTAIRHLLQEDFHGARRVLIIPENHTRNLKYFDNLGVLAGLVKEAGAEVRIGSLIAEPGNPLRVTSASGEEIDAWGLRKKGKVLETEDGFRPDLILLNNDLTAGIPEILEDTEQPIAPPLAKGWYRRRKSKHFGAYESLSREFAQDFGIDPWRISAIFHRCGMVDFSQRTGLECVALGVEKVLHATRRKYEEHGITGEPYVFIKADSGTYGMGIMTVRSGDEVFQMNKKTRNKMNTIKEGAHNTEVIIQEGVPTVDEVEGKFAEPMIYLVDGTAVGGAYRVNAERDPYSNLNAQGMEFVGMCDEEEKTSDRAAVAGCNFGAFGLIARLAALAAARED